MKAMIRALAMCLAVAAGSGCAKTAVVLGKDGVSVATEAPTFYSVIGLVKGAKAVAFEACADYEPPNSGSDDGPFMRPASDVIGKLLENYDPSKPAAGLLPTHSVEIVMACPKPND